MTDSEVHLRYHDAVSTLIGSHRYRYKRVRFSEVPELVKSLELRGYDEFAVRELNSKIAIHTTLGSRQRKLVFR